MKGPSLSSKGTTDLDTHTGVTSEGTRDLDTYTGVTSTSTFPRNIDRSSIEISRETYYTEKC